MFIDFTFWLLQSFLRSVSHSSGVTSSPLGQPHVPGAGAVFGQHNHESKLSRKWRFLPIWLVALSR